MNMECDIISFSKIIKMQTRKSNPHIFNIFTLGLILLILSADAAASDWFVRPAGGDYGSEDGSSYQDSWDGLKSVVWGAGGVEPGDNLYVCGLHVWSMTTPSDGVESQADITPISGTSNLARITIRGDYPGEPGIVWGAYKMSHNDWTDEGDGVWSIPLRGNSYPDWFFQDIGSPTNEDFVVLDKESSIANVASNPGSHYSATYEKNTLLYVKLTDGGNPTGRIYANRYGYDWVIDGLEYITFLNLKYYCSNSFRYLEEPTNHIRWEGVKLAYGEHSLISILDNCDYMEVINCELSWASNGIYGISGGNDASSNYIIKGNYIHDIGVRASTQNNDAHGIGFQGGHNGLIEGNYLVNCGNSIVLYSGNNQELTNTIVRYNYVKNSHTLGGADGKGILIQTENCCISDRTGNEIYCNVVYGGAIGYVYSFVRDLGKIYNNLAVNVSNISYKLEGVAKAIDFDAGTTEFQTNDVVTQDSGASATVRDTSQQTGSSPNIHGTISLNYVVGTFVDDEALKVNGVTYATADGANYLIRLNIDMKNCISFSPDSLHIYWNSGSGAPTASLTSEYNLFWPDTGTMFDDVHGGDPVNFSGWQAKGWDIAGSAAVDPLFIDALNGDFRLWSDSPAIDTGIDVGLTQDFQGKPVPQGSAPDIGAYEFTLNPTTDPAATGTSQNSVSLSWTMPSDDGLASMPSRYDIRYATSLITEANWDAATQVQGEPAPEDFGIGRSFTISGLTPGTTYYIAIKTSNETGSTTSPLSNVISGTTATSGNFAPVLALIGDKSVENNEYLTFTVSATDADVGDTLIYSATDLPPGASFNATTHAFEWTPTDSQGGTYHVTFQVTDGSVAVTQTIRIVVNEAPVLAAIGNKSVSEGSLLSFTISATDPDGDAIYYSATGLPVGAAFVGRTFTWTPSYTQAGTYNVTFAASDGIAQDSETITITVNNTNRAPVLDAIGDKYANEDMLLTFSVSATDPDGQAVAYSAAGLPAGATFAGQTFSWTPSSSNVGNNYPVTFRASDGQLTDSETIYITVMSDKTAPTVSNLSPAANSIQAPLNSLIILHVTDAGVGVDADTVTITLDGETIYTGDTSDYSSATGHCRRSGTKADYTYAYQSSQIFGFDENKTVTVNAADLFGNVMAERTYSFRTEMRSFGQNIRVDTTVQGINKAAPSTVRDSSGNIWAVWHAGPADGRNIYIARLRAGRNTFGASVRLTSSVADQANPAIALGTDNKLYVAWQDKRNGNWDIYASTSVDGTNWTTQTRVNDPNEGNQINPAIVVDSRSPNYAYVVWQDDRAGNQDICIASSNNSFGTKTVSQITTNTANQTNPAIAVDSTNTVYVLWTDARNATNDIYGAASGTWTNVPIVTKAGSQSNPVIATESAGTILHMLWVDQISGNSDIYYASSEGLPSNPLTGTNLIDDTLGKEQISPAIAVTGSTGNDLEVFACWHDERNVSDSSGDTDLYMVQTNAGVGTNVFVGDGDTNSNQIEPAIGTDQYGYPYLVWTDYRSTNTEIYFAGSVYLQSTPLASELITASAGGTVGTDPASITDEEDVSVVVPAGACPYDVTISITKIENQHEYGSLPFLNGYDFGPSGMTFNTPVTITIPYAVTGEAGTPTVYWYDSRAWYNPLSQQGITNVETIVITSSLHALRFKTTHFTPFYVLLGPAIAAVAETVSSGGGGGGGCTLSHSQDGSILEYFLPYGALALCMIILKRRDRRYIKRL